MHAATPSEAVRLTHEYRGRIDLLITDVVMPEMNGRDLAKILLPSYPDIQRLFLSDYVASIIARHGVLDEGVHFIQKPFSLPNMAANVRARQQSAPEGEDNANNSLEGTDF